MSEKLEKLKPSQLKREIIPLVLISVIVVSSFIYFTYQGSTDSLSYSPEVPVVDIKVSSEITNYSQQCFLKISPISKEFAKSTWANHYLAANIRKRDSDGGLSFELFQNENLFQIREDDDWILLPPGKNLDAFRTKMAFDVYNMLNHQNAKCKLPNSKLVEVYINGNYQGMYLLTERIDRKFMDLEQEDVNSFQENDAIYKASNWDGDFHTIPSTENLWEQLYPNTIDLSQLPRNLTEFINNASEPEYFDNLSGIFSFFDKNSIIDTLLFGLFVGHEILEGSSYYIIYNHKAPAKFTFIPWNFAQSWGYSEYGPIPNDIWLNEDDNQIDSVVWSKLYHRLLFPENILINFEFLSDVINRWNYIRNNIWTLDNLITNFNNLYQPIKLSLSRSLDIRKSVEDIANKIQNWIFTRLNVLDNILVTQPNIFYDNFQSPFRSDEEIFGFSTSSARRHYYKSSLLFSTQKIHEVHVVIQADYYDDMMIRKHDNNRWTDHLYVPADVTIDDYSMDNIGFRVRANYNILYPKDSFKLKFSEIEYYIGDSQYISCPENVNRRFLGLRRLNLRAAPTDFCFMNEVAGYEIFKILGIPHPRITWAKFFITETDEQGNIVKNKEYKGLYLLTEDLDKTFLNYNFINPEGNLYKVTGLNANLEYRSNVKSYYSWDGRRIFELKTNEELDDYTDLQQLVNTINNDWSNIQNIANLDVLAKYFAASNFQGNWDDYVILPHNYYIYNEPNKGFIFLPWDIEQNFNMGYNSYYSFGAPDFTIAPLLSGYRGYYPDICTWAGINSYPRPLWDNSITDSDFVNPYLEAHEKITNNSASLKAQVEAWFYLIKPTILIPFHYTDPYPVMGYPTEIYEWVFNIDKNRVLNYLDDRTTFVISQ
ncbi:MAG: CotH kinase family protein [Candidatus Thorarchaeota archaeon]